MWSLPQDKDRNSGLEYFPLAETNLKASSLKKDELIAELKKRNLDCEGGVAKLRSRLATHLKNVERVNKKYSSPQILRLTACQSKQ